MGLILNDIENNTHDIENYNVKDSMTADVNRIIVNDKNAVTVTNSMCVHLDNSVITNTKTRNNQVNDLNVHNIIYEISDEAIDKIMNKTENNEINDTDVTTNTIIYETTDEAIDENYNDEVLDLSLSHLSDCSKGINNFLQRPPTPKRKGKKFTQKKSYAILSLAWKLNEENKFSQQKMDRNKKDAKKCEILKKKQAVGKKKEAKKLARLLKQQENQHKKLNIKKEKITNKKNIQNKRAKRSQKKKSQGQEQVEKIETNLENGYQGLKPIIISDERCPKKVYLVSDNK
ncbi:uncharacterized protein LOC143366566 [Andrena cerasifolii]|uniref:uncharacterized protein LOC143366566 n=1 Tax=Andrena cerasifolii TaxID=2819439 RepID=UPI004037A544